MVAQMIKSSGGFIAALKNYDGDVRESQTARDIEVASVQ